MSGAAVAPELEDDEVDDLSEFQNDSAVQDALSKGIDLRQYAQEVEGALRQVERESIQDYIKESEGLAGLHTQIRQCDTVLDSMESMLRGFQTDLASISAQIKYLQDESLSMNVKLRNRKSAESQISGFIQQIVVPPDLINAICESDVNEAYLEYVIELNKKVTFSKLDSTAMTFAAGPRPPAPVVPPPREYRCVIARGLPPNSTATALTLSLRT
jgi:vacuolar protein sorting-associated protein 52